MASAVGSLVAGGVFVATSAGNTGGNDCGAAPRQNLRTGLRGEGPDAADVLELVRTYA